MNFVRSIAPASAALAVAVTAGVAVALVPLAAAAVAIVVITAVFAFAVARRALQPAGHALGVDYESAAAEDARFQVARVAYYAGAATIGLLTLRPALEFTTSDLIFLASLGLAAVVVLTHGLALPFLVPRAIVIGVTLFAVGGLLSSVSAVDPSASVMVVARVVYLTLVWFWLGTIVLQTREHVRTALAAWVASAAASSAGAVLQFFAGDVIPGGTVHFGRMSGFTPQLNVLGGLAATAFVPSLMLAVDGHRRVARALGVVSTGLLCAGLLLSGSVGGMLAAAVAATLWLVLRGVGPRVVLVLGALAVSALLLMSASGTTDAPSPVKRVLNVTSEEEARSGRGGTIYYRLEGFSDAWNRIERQPLVGVGLDEASTLEVTTKAVHNILLGPWLAAGLLGAVGIVVLFIGSFATGVRVLKHSPLAFRSATAALLAAIVAFAQFALGEPILYVRYGWFPVALLIALHAQRRRATSRPAGHVQSPGSRVLASSGRAAG